MYQSKADPNQIIGIMEVEDMARLQAFMEHMKESGVMDDAGVLDTEATPCNDVT